MTVLNTLLIAVSIVTVAFSIPELEWHEWKQLHGKVYTEEAEPIRQAVWHKNYQYVQQHNHQDHPFKLGLNEFTDTVRQLDNAAIKSLTCVLSHLIVQSHEEFLQVYLQQQVGYPIDNKNNQVHNIRINVTYPISLDWRTKGFVSSVSTPFTA